MKKYMLLTIGLSVVAANALVIPKLVDNGVSLISLPSSELGLSRGGTKTDLAASQDGIGIILTSSTNGVQTIDNSSYNSLLAKYASTALGLGLTLEEFLSNQYTTLNSHDQRMVDEVLAQAKTSGTGNIIVNLFVNALPEPPTPTTHTDGTSCNDSDPLTTGETWLNDVCQGGTAVSPTADGTACDDGKAWTTGTTYLSGICQGGTLVDGAACDDSNAATEGDKVTGGVCVGYVDGTLCNDGNAATTGDVYTDGVCAGIAEGLIATVLVNDRAYNDQFGYSIATDGNIVVAGAPGDDDRGTDSGSVYIYNVNGAFITKILSPDGTTNDSFGASVDVRNNRIVVGSLWDSSRGPNSGSVYLFNSDGTYVTKISNNISNTDYGIAVAISGSTIAVGTSNEGNGYVYFYDINGVFKSKVASPNGSVYFGSYINGDNSNFSISSANYTHIYNQDGVHVKTIATGGGKASDIYQEKILVGNPYADKIGVDSAGSANIYNINGVYTHTIWDQDGPYTQTLTAPLLEALANFGSSVSIGDKKIVIAAEFYDNAGAVFTYNLDGTNVKKISSNPTNNVIFGGSVAISGNILVVGDYRYTESGVYTGQTGAIFIYNIQ